MIAILVHVLLVGVCLTVLATFTRHVTLAALDCHRRGMARVMAGTSWECRSRKCRTGGACTVHAAGAT